MSNNRTDGAEKYYREIQSVKASFVRAAHKNCISEHYGQLRIRTIYDNIFHRLTFILYFGKGDKKPKWRCACQVPHGSSPSLMADTLRLEIYTLLELVAPGYRPFSPLSVAPQTELVTEWIWVSRRPAFD